MQLCYIIFSHYKFISLPKQIGPNFNKFITQLFQNEFKMKLDIKFFEHNFR